MEWVYPVVFPIEKFCPKIGAYHLPPTVHGTFATGGSLICSFVPRNVDFGEDSIPCPYPHSNVDVDEVLVLLRREFHESVLIGEGSISFHPAGVVHGPIREPTKPASEPPGRTRNGCDGRYV